MCRLKSYVGNAIDHASSVPAWLASKAVPVAADGAGLLKHAAADAADRVALFRRGWGHSYSPDTLSQCTVNLITVVMALSTTTAMQQHCNSSPRGFHTRLDLRV